MSVSALAYKGEPVNVATGPNIERASGAGRCKVRSLEHEGRARTHADGRAPGRIHNANEGRRLVGCDRGDRGQPVDNEAPRERCTSAGGRAARQLRVGDRDDAGRRVVRHGLDAERRGCRRERSRIERSDDCRIGAQVQASDKNVLAPGRHTAGTRARERVQHGCTI